MQDILLNLLFTGIGITMLCYGGNWLVNGGVVIAKKFGVSNMLIGMTVVAYGTSTPELAASIAAAGNHGEIILGNVIGSNIANVGMVVGIAAIIIPVIVEKTTIRKEIPLMLAASVLIVLLSLDGEISQFDGVFLVLLLIAFTIYAYKDIRKQQQDDIETQEKKEKAPLSKSLLLIGIGIILLYFGAGLTVDNAVLIAQFMEVPERIIGITVIAIGTSLPELITSLMAIKKGHTGIGVGNIIGSNIYNILMIMGIASTIAGIAIASEVFYDYIIMIAFSLSLLLAMRSRYIGRKIGMGLVTAYVVYLIASFMFI